MAQQIYVVPTAKTVITTKAFGTGHGGLGWEGGYKLLSVWYKATLLEQAQSWDQAGQQSWVLSQSGQQQIQSKSVSHVLVVLGEVGR